MSNIDILSIGNITEDIIKVGKKKYFSLGGTSYYAYKVAEKLGFDLGIITEISSKIDYEKHIDLKRLFFQKTNNHTIFENNYEDGIRNQTVISKPGKILVNKLNLWFEHLEKKYFYCLLQILNKK